MASEVSELSSIKDEDLLRRMWQQTEDFCRKKEVRAHMYKLREERLRNFYTGDMDASVSMSKSPMMPSHGDSLADQSFQSLKAKEIRDCVSPTRHIQYDMVTPDISGWNVVTTSNISSDGKEQCNTTFASTDAVKDVQGGKSIFSGKNEQIESHRHDGDDKNYTTTSALDSNIILKEHVVTGDANNGQTERTSNTTSSSSKTVTSSKYQTDNDQPPTTNDDFVQEFEGVLNSARRSVRENTNNEEFERIPCNKFDKEYFNSKTTNKSSASSNQQSSYEMRRNSASSTTSSVDGKRKIQRETEYLSNAPGQIISRSVEYPDANTKVITETKTLPDGSTVTTTKYESRAASSKTTSKSSTQQKSSTSRVITEDRAERNRIEIIAGDNKNVIDEMVKSKRMLDADDIEGTKADSKKTVSEKSVRKEFHCNENVSRADTKTESFGNESQEKIQRKEILVQKPIQEVENVFRETSEKKENDNISVTTNVDHRRNKQTEEIFEEPSAEKHKTVKKDLSQSHKRYTKERAYETDLSDEQFDRQPVQEELIVPKKQAYHICSPYHDHSSKPEYTNKRISVDHNPTHDAFARSLRSDTPEIDKRSTQSSSHTEKSNYRYTDRDLRSPSRETNVSDTSKYSSTTVTMPNRKSSSPDKRKPTASSEVNDISSAEQSKHSKKAESTIRKNSQTYISSKNITKSTDHYDHPRNNKLVYDIPSNNAPVNENSIRKNSSSQPSYSRPTASSTRHNNKPENDDFVSKKQPSVNEEPLYEIIGDRRQPSNIDSKTTFTTSVTRETKDYRNKGKSSLNKQSSIRQPDYEPDFDTGRSNSPTSSVSDIEYVNFSNRKVTDLDEVQVIINVKDRSIHGTSIDRDTQDGLFLSTHKKKASSPSVESDTDTIVDDQGKEPFYLIESEKDVKERRREKPQLTRSETYEERCRSMLGMKEQSEEITDERATLKNSKKASVDLIMSEQKVEARTPSRSPTKSPDRKVVTNVSVNVNRSPSRSPERRSKASTDSTTVEEERLFDTFTRVKSSHSSLPNRAPVKRNESEEKFESDTVTFDKKSSKTTNDHSMSPNRSNSTSPDRKRKSEATKQFIKEESRSNSYSTTTIKTKDTKTATSGITREISPKRESKFDVAVSPERSPNRSPNVSPSRKGQRQKEQIVEATKKMLNSENDVRNVQRKSSKSELRRSVVENTKERDVKTAPASKQNKINKEPYKSSTTLGRTSPTHTKTDETYTETSEIFFSETKADTIKRRPITEIKSQVGKNTVSPDQKPSTATASKFSTDENKANPKKPTNVSVSTDVHDVNKVTTNTFTRKMCSESNEPLPSPTKPKAKITTADNSIVTSGKQTSTFKTKIRPAKIDVKAKSKPKQADNNSTDDDADEDVATKKSTKKLLITERKDSAPVYRSTKVEKEVKMARSTSEHFSGKRKGSKPEIETPKSPVKFDKRPTKCMTTKTINLSTANTLNSEDMENVIIDIQQAKSSREPTPNRIIPTPVSPEEDTGMPRYPDTVHEPDDERPQRRPNVKNIPIFEEDTKELFASCHITEVSEDYDATDSDECMLSVSDKVTKFSTKVTSPTNDKFKRTVVETVNEFAEDIDDECRLSVQGKVSKFTAIAEEVSTTKASTKMERNTPSKVNKKVALFNEKEIKNSKTSKQSHPEPARSVDRVKTARDFEDFDETLKSDECLLSVSDKVNKFVASAETITASVPEISDVKSPELVAKIHRQVSLRENVNKKVTDRPTPPDQHDSIYEKAPSKGKITDRYVPNKPRQTGTTSAPISLSSIDVVKKAKSIFESGDLQEAPKQRDILSRPSVWEHKRSEAAKDVKLTDIGVFKNQVDTNSEIDSKPSCRSPETRRSTGSPETLYRSSCPPEPGRGKPRFPKNEDCADKDEPVAERSYMNHTIASLEHIRRDSIDINKTNIRKSAIEDDQVDQVEINPRSSVKFGVELKRTNSQQSAGRRKSSCSEIPHVEEIFELELLERMLETVVGYEQRRRIRAQIRLVKKQIQGEQQTKHIKKTINSNGTDFTMESVRRKKEPSPTRKSSPLRKKNEDVSENTLKQNKMNRTTSPVRKISSQRKLQIDNDEYITSEHFSTEVEEESLRRSISNRKSFIDRNDEGNSYTQKSHDPSLRSNTVSISSNLRNTDNNSKSADHDKPIWARKNILTKASDSNRTFTSSGKKTTVTKVHKQKTVEQNDDCVTSSYGVGPTDEDGKPLFGIRALKKKSPVVTSKASGTIIQETLFSENGAPVTVNRTTTMYSSDPQDVRHFVESNNATASDIRKRLIERENVRREKASDTSENKSNKQSKILRRGSVKELSEKFQKESTTTSEKSSSSYPKAGLILRTQISRESTPGANSSFRSGSADFDDCDIEVRCSSSSRLQSDDEIEFKTSTSRESHSFLNTNSKVSDVQDVLNRMRNADNVVEDGDTEEDKEARALLNKFLGASVLMSGMESMVPKEITTIVGKPNTQRQGQNSSNSLLTLFFAGALKHSPSKRKSLSRVAQRSTEADSDSHPVAGTSYHNHHHHHHNNASATKPATPTTAAPSAISVAPSKPIVTTAPSQTSPAITLPPLKQKTAIVKSKVPPPVPPRGSPKDRRAHKTGTSPRATPPGTAPSCCSTPPPAFDDISEGSSIHRPHHHDERGSVDRRVYMSGSTSRSTAYRDYTVSISEIRLDSHLAVDTSSGSQYGSRGALVWTPPASVEGSTPTYTEGTPSFTESSSSGDMAFSGNSSPLNTSASDRHKPTVEEALNSLTSEMTRL